MVDPALMCRQHLLGEHVEIHMLAGTLRREKSIEGFLDRELIEPQNMQRRHDQLVGEMTKRGYNHRSPLIIPDCELPNGDVDVVYSIRELHRRCEHCRRLIDARERTRDLVGTGRLANS